MLVYHELFLPAIYLRQGRATVQLAVSKCHRCMVIYTFREEVIMRSRYVVQSHDETLYDEEHSVSQVVRTCILCEAGAPRRGQFGFQGWLETEKVASASRCRRSDQATKKVSLFEASSC